MKKNEVKPLTGLRGIAAYCILVSHAITISFTYNSVNPLQAYATRLAYFGMSLFFILSGFVIYFNYHNVIKVEGYILGGYKFIVSRIARLYPLYLLMILFTLDKVPSKLFSEQPFALFSYLTMTQSWFNLQMITFPPAWSISTEWFFYFAFIFMLPLFEKIKKPLLALSIFSILIFLTIPFYIQFQTNYYTTPDGWITYFSPFTRIFEFITGMLACKAHLKSKIERGGGKRISSIIYNFMFSFLPNYSNFRPLRSNYIFYSKFKLYICTLYRPINLLAQHI
jgi:peptidoglycan/LPS O-acetylase OafA/YrhL